MEGYGQDSGGYGSHDRAWSASWSEPPPAFRGSWPPIRSRRCSGSFIGSVSEGRVVFLLLTIAVFFVFGMILDGLPAILIFFPILFPIAQTLGIHPLHFGVLVIAIVGISIVAPPIGLCLVIICSLAKIKLTDTIKPLIPYTLILVIDLIVMAFWPWLVLFLPALFKV